VRPWFSDPRVRRRSARPGPAVAILALAAAACTSRDVTVHPFRLEAVVFATGRSVADEATFPSTIIVLEGKATVVDEVTLDVADATRGQVRLRFDRTAAPEVAFPARLSGQDVRVDLFVDPGQLGPADGVVVPISGLRVTTTPATLTYDFILGETSAHVTSGGPDVPFSFLPFLGGFDPPPMRLEVDFREMDPARCGPVYLAVLSIELADRTIDLRRGEQAEMVVVRPEPLHVLHVQSYQRRGTCSGQSESWTQIAAWR
jgi:hypothetical protein